MDLDIIINENIVVDADLADFYPDTVGVEDTVDIEANPSISINEQVTVTDAIPFMYRDTIFVDDFTHVENVYGIEAHENIGVEDTLKNLFPETIFVNEFIDLDLNQDSDEGEDVTVTDVVTVGLVYGVSVSDNITLVEAPIFTTLSINVFDNISVTEGTPEPTVVTINVRDNIFVKHFIYQLSVEIPWGKDDEDDQGEDHQGGVNLDWKPIKRVLVFDEGKGVTIPTLSMSLFDFIDSEDTTEGLGGLWGIEANEEIVISEFAEPVGPFPPDRELFTADDITVTPNLDIAHLQPNDIHIGEVINVNENVNTLGPTPISTILIFAVDIIGTSEGTTNIPTTVHFQVDNDGTLMTDLQSYWKFDENASGVTRIDTIGSIDLLDFNSVGNVNPAVVNQGVQVTQGSTNFLFADSPFHFQNLFGEFSMAFWINPETNAYMGILNKIWQTSLVGTNPGYFIDRNATGSGGQMNVYLNGASGFLVRTSSITLTTSVYHLVIVTWDGTWNAGNIKIYIDNNDVSGGTATSGSLSSMSNTYPFNIGRNSQDPTAGVTYGSFRMDEFGLWSKVLSAQERTDLWDMGSGQTIVPN